VTISEKIEHPLFTLIEYTFFAILIFQQLKSPALKRLLVILSIFFFLFQIIYFIAHNKPILDSIPLFFQDFINWIGIPDPVKKKNNLDSVPIGIEAILIFVFIFFFLYEQLIDVKDTPIYANYFFWMAIGLFIYLGGSLFIYLMANNLLSTEEVNEYWFFTYIVETIKNLLFAAAIFIYSKQPEPKKLTKALPNLDFTL
jgi:hypothetical protein